MDTNKAIYDVKNLFKDIDKSLLLDQNYLEKTLIINLGLNDEILNEQPKELSQYFGAGLGLRIWQYPNQFSGYLVELSKQVERINSYLEIGCRHGGTFILTTEFLKSLNPSFIKSTAIDIIPLPDFLSSYLSNSPYASFIQVDSSSEQFKTFIENNFFDLIFIDGNHDYDFVKKDAESTRESCNIQVFHDTVNDACPGVGIYWNELKQTHSELYNFFDFTDQYDSVIGNFLGVGLAIRKEFIEY
jgi:hypothetical protein